MPCWPRSAITFLIVRGDLGAGQFEIGAQAGIFSLFNLDSDSFNLVNMDRAASFITRARTWAMSFC
jgi:hypothetical protein